MDLKEIEPKLIDLDWAKECYMNLNKSVPFLYQFLVLTITLAETATRRQYARFTFGLLTFMARWM
jgi:hypothetical protein